MYSNVDYGEDKRCKLSIRQQLPHISTTFSTAYVFSIFARDSVAHVGHQEYSEQANKQCYSLRSSLDVGSKNL